MIKANELRIGNWIKVMRSLPKEVTGYHLYMMQNYKPIDTNEADYSEMTDPILLTEEWLLKFGFLLNRNKNYVLRYANNRQFLIHQGFLFYTSNKSYEIKHIHQLQNLYFALTGKELDIRL